jgi:hypothetical protein
MILDVSGVPDGLRHGIVKEKACDACMSRLFREFPDDQPEFIQALGAPAATVQKAREKLQRRKKEQRR